MAFQFPDRADLVYIDLQDSCRPAELVDLTGDSLPELVSYHDPQGRFPRSCDAFLCYSDLEILFDVYPAWTQVRSWNGSGWNESPPSLPSYYIISTDPDPDPTEIERDLYEEAAAPGIHVEPGLSLAELAQRLDGLAIAILLYEQESGVADAHFSPPLAVGDNIIELPNSDEALPAPELEVRRAHQGMFRQCVIASASCSARLEPSA